MDIQEFLQKLQELEGDERVVKANRSQCLGWNLTEHQYAEIVQPLDGAATDLLCGEIMSRTGETPNCDIIRQSGRNLFPVEKDSFGWLIGGISTSKGTLTFG